MNKKLDEILDGLPEKPSRSCLESFGDFIKELRRRKRTYREIAQILEDKCELRVSKSTVHRFVRARARQSGKAPRSPGATPTKAMSTEINPSVVSATTRTMDEVRRHIEEFKGRPVAGEMSAKEFRYDREEPLHLLPEIEKDRSGRQ